MGWRTMVKRLSLIVVARAFSERLMLRWKIVAQAKLLLLLPFQGKAGEACSLAFRQQHIRKRTKRLSLCVPPSDEAFRLKEEHAGKEKVSYVKDLFLL